MTRRCLRIVRKRRKARLPIEMTRDDEGSVTVVAKCEAMSGDVVNELDQARFDEHLKSNCRDAPELGRRVCGCSEGHRGARRRLEGNRGWQGRDHSCHWAFEYWRSPSHALNSRRGVSVRSLWTAAVLDIAGDDLLGCRARVAGDVSSMTVMRNGDSLKARVSKQFKQGKIPFVDLFCGAGGLSAGFERAGFSACYAVDNDVAAVETFRLNHPHCHTVCKGIEDVRAAEIFKAVGSKKVPLVVGGPNCQGVSLRGKRNPDDPKNRMFFHFHRLIAELQPDWFVMENVPGLLHKHNLDLASDIFAAFDELGYRCGADVLLAADYGVPQLRYRLFLVGNKVGADVAFPRPTNSVPNMGLGQDIDLLAGIEERLPEWGTVFDALGDLPPLENGGGEERVAGFFREVPAMSEFQRWCRGRSVDLHNHICHRTNDSNIRLIKHIPPGGNWRNIPPRVRPARFARVALKDHTTTYGRLAWDKPSRTVTTYFNNITCGAFTHPDQDRGISVREGARLQSFPDSFKFTGPLARQYRQVGNAVPSLLAYHVALSLKASIVGGRTVGPRLIAPAVEFSSEGKKLRFNRPVKGMRFNLDKHLVTL